MAINLTNPIVVPDAAYQGITRIDFHFPHYLDGSVMKIDKSKIICVFMVTTWTGDGVILTTSRHVVEFTNWPVNFTADMRSIYNRIEQYAISSGIINPGTGEQL